jgi:hypothetical protein
MVMISPLTRRAFHSRETVTRAGFWNERKWHWILEAVLFAILGLACAWPIVAAGGAVLELFQRVSL